MGLLSAFTPKTVAVETTPAAVTPRSFAVEIDPVFFSEFTGGHMLPGSLIQRRIAMQVPSLKRGVELVAGGIGQLPIDVFAPDGTPAKPDYTGLMNQPEFGIPRVVTFSKTVKDLILDGLSFWRVTARNWTGFPTFVEHCHMEFITIQDTGHVYYKDTLIPDADLIQFTSPNTPLLRDGKDAIVAHRLLDKAALRNAQGMPPVDYFEPTDGYNLSEDELKAFMTAWKTARFNGSTGYIPEGLKYTTVGFNADDSQMSDARKIADTQIANLIGLDSEYVNISTTSRTYANAYDRRRFMVDFTFAPYLIAIEQRLNMNSVTPKGYYVKFNLNAFLRGNTTERYANHQAALDMGLYDLSYAQALEDLPIKNNTPQTQKEPA